jgi:actin-related protein
MEKLYMFSYYKNNNDVIYAYEENQIPIKGLIKISEEEKDFILNKSEQEYLNSITYSQKRKNEYPPIEDYLDSIVKNDQVQLKKYIDDCLSVKLKYPKP